MIRDRVKFVAACGLLIGCVEASTSDPPSPEPEPEPQPEPTPVASWGTARGLIDLAGSSVYPTTLVDAHGDALAVWLQADPSHLDHGLWAVRRLAGQWQPPTRITSDPDLASELVVVGDATAASATWLESRDNTRRVVVSQQAATGAWTPPLVLRASSWQQGGLLAPRAAVGNGHVAVVWAHQDPATQRVTLELRHRADGQAWSIAPPPAASGIALASYQRPFYDIAFDDAGAMVVTWIERQAASTEIWSRVGEPTEGSLSIIWQPATRVLAIPGDPNQLPVRELWTGTHAGRSYAAWLLTDPSGAMSVGSSHRRADGQWDAEPATHTMQSRHYAAPKLAAGAGGHKVVVWREPSGESSRMLARTFDPDAGWGPDQVIADQLKPPYLGCIDQDAHYFDVAIEPDGNAVAIWEERLDEKINGRSVMAIWSSQLVVGKGWQSPVRIDGSSGHASAPRVALGSGMIGLGLYTVQHDDGNTALWVNELAPTTD